MSEGRITAIIVEDEQSARERLTRFLQERPEIEVLEQVKDGLRAVESINEKQPDLVFLDVQIPSLSGIDVLRRVKEPPAIIFTTAYDEYAIEAFEVHAVDYLLKPYSKERFHKAVDRAVRALEAAGQGSEERSQLQGLLNYYHREEEYLERVTVRKGYDFHVIPVQDVDYFKAENGLVFLHQSGEQYVIDISLTQLEDELDPTEFLRIHRNAIINLSRIVKIVPWGQGQLGVSFGDEERLLVSRSHLNQFRRRVGMRL